MKHDAYDNIMLLRIMFKADEEENFFTTAVPDQSLG